MIGLDLARTAVLATGHKDRLLGSKTTVSQRERSQGVYHHAHTLIGMHCDQIHEAYALLCSQIQRGLGLLYIGSMIHLSKSSSFRSNALVSA